MYPLWSSAAATAIAFSLASGARARQYSQFGLLDTPSFISAHSQPVAFVPPSDAHTSSHKSCNSNRNPRTRMRRRDRLITFAIDSNGGKEGVINLGELTECDRQQLLRSLLVDAKLLSPTQADDISISGNNDADSIEQAKSDRPFVGGYQSQTLGRGFCNWVYRVADAAPNAYTSSPSQQSPRVSPSSVVVKIFSDLAKVRVEEQILGSIDVVASDVNIGPRVLHRGPSGIVMAYVDGCVLTEEDVHGIATDSTIGNTDFGGGGKELCRSIAQQLARLHATKLPSALKANEIDNMMWHTLDAMLDFVGSDDPIPPAVLKAGWSYDELVEEVREMKDMLRPLHLSKVLCHGDFKPSNIIVRTDCHAGHDLDRIVLIDYELSGPGYRGFDFYKLFRTANSSAKNRDNMVAFIESYICESMQRDGVSAQLVENVLAEMKLFEPLTVSS